MDKLRRERHGFAVWAGGWMVLLAMAGGGPAHGQAVATAPAGPVSPYDGRTIRALSITGLQTIDEAYVRNQITSRAGQPYSQATVQRDVSRLLQKGYFLDVRAEPTPVDNEVNLTFTLAEKPKVAGIEFSGNRKFKPKDLIGALPFGVGDALDLYDVRRGAEAIQRMYHEKGYAHVEVTFDEALLQSERRVVYRIVENERVRVRSIVMDGNTAFKTKLLKSQIATKTYFPIFRTGDFDAERAERDAATLRQYYRDRGYLDAEVGYETTYLDVARERLRVTFHINEGTLYNVKEIRVEGNHLFSTDEIVNRMRLQVGEAFNNIQLQADVKELTEERYGAQGYIEVRIVPSWIFAEEPAQVIVTLAIEEGEQFRVGNIVVHGHFRTQEKVVRRELRLDPDEIYNLPEDAQGGEADARHRTVHRGPDRAGDSGRASAAGPGRGGERQGERPHHRVHCRRRGQQRQRHRRQHHAREPELRPEGPAAELGGVLPRARLPRGRPDRAHPI
jgi:outer membrane protein insertion porin family